MQGKFLELGLIVDNFSIKQNLLQRSQFVIFIDDKKETTPIENHST